MVSLDAPAPDFEALTTQGQRLRLSSLRGRPVVLFFFPAAFTPVCTREAKEFGDVLPQLRAAGAEVVGISTDEHQVQCDFAVATGATYPMVGDPEAGIARSYDVVWPLLKRTQRVTFVIDAQGIIRGIFHHELRVGHHVRMVVRAVQALATAAR
ncbi:peroxiredoxin [Aggregicoccus sp. 17bor-14]|uniref:peroxiredoxin family protein n=1 Tax=Myxococcaceae TaxID=31 RepID=UPI00129C7B68|nr:MULTISPECIES: peroxiredoxin family protein [Myxococcaceae]MBF5041949.1 peroxiredoxin [Simulacricoccus sp. 17bor-14]MRI87730.1 peroxiredoxin [Aggregicoccus sp. 17bor-14]